MRTLVMCGLVIVLGAQSAYAQDFDAAAKHFASAQEAFAREHFKTAAVEFQRAYDITKDPILLFNIGESWQKAGDGKKAVQAYKDYIRLQPVAQDKDQVAKRIKAIEAKRYRLVDQSAPGDVPPAEIAQAPTPPPAPEPAPAPPAPAPEPAPAAPAPAAAPVAPAPEPPPQEPTTPSDPEPTPAPAPAPKAAAGLLDGQPPSKMRVAAWIGVATTVAVLTAGAIFGLAAQSRADEIERRFRFVDSTGQPRTFDMDQAQDYRNLKDEGELYNGLAIGFFSAAGALAITTTTLFIVDYKRQSRRALTVAPVLGRDQAGLQAAWRF